MLDHRPAEVTDFSIYFCRFGAQRSSDVRAVHYTGKSFGVHKDLSSCLQNNLLKHVDSCMLLYSVVCSAHANAENN